MWHFHTFKFVKHKKTPKFSVTMICSKTSTRCWWVFWNCTHWAVCCSISQTSSVAVCVWNKRSVEDLNFLPAAPKPAADLRLKPEELRDEAVSSAGCSALTDWSSSAVSEDPVRHWKKSLVDCGCGKSDIDSAAGSEGPGLASVWGSDSSDCDFLENIIIQSFVQSYSFDSEKFSFHCSRHSGSLSLSHRVEDQRTCFS